MIGLGLVLVLPATPGHAEIEMVRIGIKPGTIVREQETAPRRTFPIATSLH